jgi:transcriptional regulator with XRE-family HTH domain
MQTIGERLEEARKRKGLSIREAAEATKIRSDYLQKFEANSFDIDLPPLYIRGFVRNYARYLDLDGERVAQEFYSAYTGETKAARRDNREVFGRVDFGESGAEEAAPAPGRTGPDQAILLKFAVLGGAAIVIVVLLLLIINLFTSKPAAPARGAPANSAQAAPPPAAAEHTLTLVARGQVRVKITRLATNQVLLDGLTPLNAGEQKVIRYRDRLRVTVDDPAKLSIEIDGAQREVPIKEYGYFHVDPSD